MKKRSLLDLDDVVLPSLLRLTNSRFVDIVPFAPSPWCRAPRRQTVRGSFALEGFVCRFLVGSRVCPFCALAGR